MCDSESICLEKTSEKTEKKEILPVKDQTLNTSHTLLWWLYSNMEDPYLRAEQLFFGCLIGITQKAGGEERVGEHKNKGITEEQRKGFKYSSKVREQVFHRLAPCGCGHSTCVVSQGGYRALWWKHALHPAGLLGVVEAEEVGLSKTQGITWEKKKHGH